jgi:Mg-chelatase subunit ChlD
VRVAIAIDTSASTIDPVGSDINDNGYVGAPLFVETTDGSSTLRSTDLGDTAFAAEVSGSRSLAHAIARSGNPVALITFSGSRPTPDGSQGTSKIVAPLSTDIATLEQAFRQVLATGSIGSTDLAEGILLARSSLAESPSSLTGESKNIVLLISDSPSPLLQDESAIRDAVVRAASEGVVIHTFAVAPSGRDAPGLLGEIALLSGGTFHLVTEATGLHCALATALSP